jgi:hypothetical protein
MYYKRKMREKHIVGEDGGVREGEEGKGDLV